jgi:hypothetical protein
MLTAKYLRKILFYDPDTGVWTWLAPTSRRVHAGDQAGYIDINGYWRLGIGGRYYVGSRLVFLYMTGKWPSHFVDHIDRDHANDRWYNLRQATYSQNRANSGLPRHNTSGVKGVYWCTRKKKWEACIECDYRRFRLGYFSDLAEAHRAYRTAAVELFGDFGG